jgi:hypothetical protein
VTTGPRKLKAPKEPATGYGRLRCVGRNEALT